MSLLSRFRLVARDEGGFTLIELLSALAILLTVMGTLTILMTSATKSEVDLTRRVQAQQQARLALEMIRHEIHRACKAEYIDLATGNPPTPLPAVYSTVRLTPPVSSGCPSTTDPSTAVTWCMEGSGNRWRVRRVAGTPTSCTGGRPEADYITASDVFTFQQPSGSLATLNVNFPVDIDPASPVGGSYRLVDNLVLRNSTRAP